MAFGAVRPASSSLVAVLLMIVFFCIEAFTSYGAFWLSFATLFVPDSGIADAYKTAAPNTEDNAIGIYLLSWMIVTFLFL